MYLCLYIYCGCMCVRVCVCAHVCGFFNNVFLSETVCLCVLNLFEPMVCVFGDNEISFDWLDCPCDLMLWAELSFDLPTELLKIHVICLFFLFFSLYPLKM